MKLSRFFALALATIPAFANAEGSLVSEDKAFSIAAETYKAYQYGGASEMLSAENSCWNTLKKQGNNEEKAASCVVAGVSGAFIEAAIARSQGRSPTPVYRGDGIRERALKRMAKAGISEAQAQQIIEETIKAHQKSIIYGLSAAGMR